MIFENNKKYRKRLIVGDLLDDFMVKTLKCLVGNLLIKRSLDSSIQMNEMFIYCLFVYII